VIKIGRSARAGKVTAMENGLKPGWLALPDQVDLFHTRRAAPATPASPIEIPARFLVGTRFLFSFRTMLIVSLTETVSKFLNLLVPYSF
jgi:hypothetical protein